MKFISFLHTVVFITVFIMSLAAQQEVSILSGDVTIVGTLLDTGDKADHAVLIITGSGPTDRDGNSALGFTNNSLKMLAEGLDALGYASLRYDKRGVGASKLDSAAMAVVKFDDFVGDAVACVRYLKDRYNHVTVLGHSLGALVGMLAAQEVCVDRFISLAGMSEDIGTTLERQLGNQPPQVLEAALPIMESLRKGEKVDSVPLFLYSIFAPRLQNFMMSVMAHDPRKEIAQLHIPVLCIQGNTDLQVTVEGQQSLSEKAIYGEFAEIDSMNHVLKTVARDAGKNIATYRDSLMPLHRKLLPVIDDFLKGSSWYEAFYYLVGKWSIEGKDSYEIWMLDKETQSIKGVNYTETGDERIIQENLEIRQESDGIIYYAQPINQNAGKAVPFLFFESSPVYSFLNAAHDFPNTIIYTPLTQDTMEVTVRGNNGGATVMKYVRK